MAKTKNTRSAILEGYIDYLLEHGKEPESIYSFCKKLNIKEKEFYEYFGSFEGIDGEVWKDFFATTVERLNAEKAYTEYSAREKLLAFYYTFVEELGKNRSYVTASVKCGRGHGPFSQPFRAVKEPFTEYVKEIISQGITNGEVEDRKFLSDKYYLGFWPQLAFVIDFWIKDHSAKFEKTDAAIEKAVNLSFDLLAKNPLDSLLDFGKFVFQSR